MVNDKHNNYKDGFVHFKELEERCSSYQNDLYIIRNELMNLQREADQAEETNAKFNEDLSELLQSEFHLDGQSIFKPNHQLDPMNGNALILSRIKEISFLWRDLIEKKGTLERTVTKLSIPQGHPHSSGSSHETPSIALSNQSPLSSNSNIIDLFNEPFFPPKIDSFGLETILEEDRSEDEAHRCESSDLIYDEAFGGSSGAGSSQTRRKGTPSPATTTFNCSTQTDELEEPTSDREPAARSLSTIQASEWALLQARAKKWDQDEADLMGKVRIESLRLGCDPIIRDTIFHIVALH